VRHIKLDTKFEKIIEKLRYYEEIFDIFDYLDDYIIVTELKVARVSKDATEKWIQECRKDIIWEYEIHGDTIHIKEFSGVVYTIDLKTGDIINWE